MGGRFEFKTISETKLLVNLKHRENICPFEIQNYQTLTHYVTFAIYSISRMKTNITKSET